VLEIGAGTGVLTEALMSRAARVVAVELDDALFNALRWKFRDESSVHLIHQNALGLDPCEWFSGEFKLVANIPYYITAPLLRHYLEARCRSSRLVLMVQREVAERITALPGNLSLLGLSVQYYARARIVARVPASAFFPRPKVDSAIVALEPCAETTDERAATAFFQVARAGFGTRRKQLVNALALGLKMGTPQARDLLLLAGIGPERRAQELSVREWESLAVAWLSSGVGADSSSPNRPRPS
jgi:16S rRNA (adenine1518-N6/adenine1519-N6)-dimethyltransferase